MAFVKHMRVVVYIVECVDKTLYTGCTNNLHKRLREHNSGSRGAKYTRARRPVRLVYTQTCSSLRMGRKHEAEIKRLTRQEKIALCHGSL